MANLLAAPNLIPKISKTSKGAGNTAYTSRATDTAASDAEEEVQRPVYETDNFIRTPYGLVNKSAGDFMDFLPSAEDLANLSDAQKANILGGFAPGAATVEIAGGYPAFPEDKETTTSEMFMGERSPSMLENIEEGNLGIAALQGLGAIGDAFTVIPVIGSVAGTPFKAPNVLRKGIEALGDVSVLRMLLKKPLSLLIRWKISRRSCLIRRVTTTPIFRRRLTSTLLSRLL